MLVAKTASRFVVPLALLSGCTTELPVEGTTLPVPDRPCLTLDLASLSFGEIPLGEPVPEQTVTFGNPCGQPVEITELSLADDLQTGAFALVEAPELPVTIEPDDGFGVTVQVEPDGFGRFYDVLTVRSTDPQVPEESVSLLLDSVCVSIAVDEDDDGDGVPNDCDICPNFADDGRDTDEDGIPDQCDACPVGDDADDEDLDEVPDACDACPGFDDLMDSDGDGVPDGCDV